MAENYYLLLSARSMAQCREEKSYLLRIYHSGHATPIQIENSFIHNYEYVFKLWTCRINKIQSIHIQMFQKFTNQANRQILVKRGESKSQIQCTVQGEKFRFYGEMEKSVLLLHFRVESIKSIEHELSNEKLKQMNSNMERHLNSCKEELRKYQDFLINTNNVIKELNSGDLLQKYQSSHQDSSKMQRPIRQNERDQRSYESKGGRIRININSQPKNAQRQLQNSHLSPNEEDKLTNYSKSFKFAYFPSDKSQQIEHEAKKNQSQSNRKKEYERSAREKSLLSRYRYLEGNQNSVDAISDQNEQQEQSDEQAGIQQTLMNKMTIESEARPQQKSQSKQTQKTKTFSAPKQEEKKLDLSSLIRKRREQYLGRSLQQEVEKKQVQNESKVVQNGKDSPINKIILSKIQKEPITANIEKQKPVSEVSMDKNNEKIPEPSRKSTISKPKQIVQKRQQFIEHHEQEIMRDIKDTIVRQAAFPLINSNKKTLFNNSTKIGEDSAFRSLSSKKKTDISRKNTEDERSHMPVDEDKNKKDDFSALQANPNGNLLQQLSLSRLKAVLFTNNNSIPKRCLIEFQTKTFQTNVKESQGNMVAWSSEFQLEGIRQTSYLRCIVISSLENRVKEEGETLILGSDILTYKGNRIKAYLYKDELAVGYLELQFTRGVARNDRKTISLPEIKKRTMSQVNPGKKMNPISSNRVKTEQNIVEGTSKSKKKLQRINQSLSSRKAQKNTKSQKSSLSRLKERKLKRKAKISK